MNTSTIKNFMLSKFRQFEKSYLNTALLLLFIVIIPYIFLAFFSVPASDDFGQSAESLNLGILGFIKYRYLTWNGRYSSDFLIAFYNVIGHKFDDYFLINFFYIVPLFVLLLYTASSSIFISLITESKNFKLNLLFALISLVSIIVHTELNSTVF